MKIKNEYVQVKIGNKTFTKRNMILDKFIKRVFNSQMDLEHSTAEIINCYLKFDTPIGDIDYDTNVPYSTFDVTFWGGTEKTSTGIDNFAKMSQTTNNAVKIIYNFDARPWFEYNHIYYSPHEFSMFAGKKITAIGFGYASHVFAVVDTNNMNIYVDRDENISITRVDLYQSDGVVKGFDYPLHLVNDLAHYQDNFDERTYAQLYSVGFGNIMGIMEEEHLIGDVTSERGDTYIILNVEREKKLGHYPSEDLQLGFYPTIDNSKYLIFKYRLYKKIITINEQYETETSYEMAIRNLFCEKNLLQVSLPVFESLMKAINEEFCGFLG